MKCLKQVLVVFTLCFFVSLDAQALDTFFYKVKKESNGYLSHRLVNNGKTTGELERAPKVGDGAAFSLPDGSFALLKGSLSKAELFSKAELNNPLKKCVKVECDTGDCEAIEAVVCPSSINIQSVDCDGNEPESCVADGGALLEPFNP